MHTVETLDHPLYVDIRNLRYVTASKLTPLDDTSAMLSQVVAQHIDSAEAPCALKAYAGIHNIQCALVPVAKTYHRFWRSTIDPNLIGFHSIPNIYYIPPYGPRQTIASQSGLFRLDEGGVLKSGFIEITGVLTKSLKVAQTILFVALNETNANIVLPTTMTALTDVHSDTTPPNDLLDVAVQLRDASKRTNSKYSLLGGVIIIAITAAIGCCCYCACAPLRAIWAIITALFKIVANVVAYIKSKCNRLKANDEIELIEDTASTLSGSLPDSQPDTTICHCAHLEPSHCFCNGLPLPGECRTHCLHSNSLRATSLQS